MVPLLLLDSPVPYNVEPDSVSPAEGELPSVNECNNANPVPVVLILKKVPIPFAPLPVVPYSVVPERSNPD